MLIRPDADNIAFLSLIASIVGAVLGLVSAVAAIFAALYAKRAATRNDLAPVEQNTPHLERVSDKVLSIDAPILPQVEQEAPQVQVQVPIQRIPISVEGEAMGEVPLELLLTVQDSSVRVSRVERLSEAGKTLGSSPCKATDRALVFKSILAPEKVRQWWDAGESASDGEARSVLRVYLLLDGSGREVCREVPVSIVEGLRNVGIATLVVWTIKGSI